MNNIKAETNLSVRLLPKIKDCDRFSHKNDTNQTSNYEIIDPQNNKVWGYVTIDDNQRGPALGGIRMVPNLNFK